MLLKALLFEALCSSYFTLLKRDTEHISQQMDLDISQGFYTLMHQIFLQALE